MRLRILASATTIALAVGLLSAVPASAAYGVAIDFPGGNSSFYSPFGGPASITFTFDGSENDATFEARLILDGTKIRSKQILIDPDTQTSPRVVEFSWPAVSTTSDRVYVVKVVRNGVTRASESFQLLPPLVRITGASPNPFFPWIDDGYKDTTTVKFRLEASADAEAHVWKANTAGKCCGSKVLDESVGMNLPAGPNTWVWDGQGEGEHGTAGNRPKGSYFVKIKADDGVVAPRISKPYKVTIARTYRATATKAKPAVKYHHRSAATPLVIAGNCYVTVETSNLRVLCQGAKITVYWRWGLNDSQRIEHVGFVYDFDGATCPRSIRRIGHSKHESSFTMYEDLVGSLGLCRLVTAKITYSFPKES